MKDYTNILNWSEEEILNEVQDIRYLYKLKEVVRYNIPRKEEYLSETVAEHVYGMLTLARYFLMLDDPKKEMDQEKIMQIILWHDADEIETSDTPTHLKTETEVQEGKDALVEVVKRSPEILQESIAKQLQELEELKTKEAQFVKALDKLEPSFHLFSENARIMLVNGMGFTEKQFNYVERNKHDYTQPFPVMHKFQGVLERYQRQNNYFTKDE